MPVSLKAATGAMRAHAGLHVFRRCAVLMLALLPLLVCAQSRFIKAGDKAYDRLAYAEAINSYERAAENNISDTVYARRLAESYMHVRNFKQAEVWYARAMQMRNVKPVDVYNYAQVLRANAKYDSSDQQLAKYQGMKASDSRSRRQMGSAAYTARLRENRIPGCVVKDLALNTAGADMGPTLKSGGIVFASDRGKEVLASRRHTWNGRPFLDLFYASNGSTFQWEVMDEFSSLNTKFHESNATFAPDGKTIWFTRNNYYHGHKGQDVQKHINLKIYGRSLQADGWGNERSFIHNSEQWSVGHPCLSADGNTTVLHQRQAWWSGGHGHLEMRKERRNMGRSRESGTCREHGRR